MTLSYFTYQLGTVSMIVVVAVAVAFVLLGVDDLLLDLAYWIHKIYRAAVTWRFRGLTLDEIRAKEQQRIAIFVPCWNEHEIIDKMAELACRTIQYGRYEIFVGVYPNDPATIEKANAAARRFPRVRVVVNERDGPTTKAQNLNQIYNEMMRLEGADPYSIIVLHDVEDVIHPTSLMLYNFLIPRRDMVQLPVFPLERAWNKWTAWTYADEFAENHLKDLVIREALGSFVPCAGVGCAFNRSAIESLGIARGELFPTESLTEDYELGLRLRENGFSTVMVNQRLAHKNGVRYNLTAAEYVATREFFPDTFKTAIRQKARWITGICFQAWKNTGWSGGFFTRYTLYRDRKAIVTNFLVLIGYFALAFSSGLWLWSKIDRRVTFVNVGGLWWEWPLLNLVFAFTLVRMFQKAYFVASIYGSLQGVLALVRIPWSSVINAFAAAQACRQVAFAAMTGTQVMWAKTTHAFPTAFPTHEAVREYRRQLGEVLIEEQLVTSDDIALALAERQSGERIGQTLVRLGYLTAREVMGAVAKQIGATDGIDDDLVPTPEALALVGVDEARHWMILPLRVEDGCVLVAVDDEPSIDLEAFLDERLPGPHRAILVQRRRLVHAIERSYTYVDARRKPLGAYLLDRGFITRKQLEAVLAEQDRKSAPLFEIIVGRGLLSSRQISDVFEGYFGTPFVVPPSDARIPAEYVHDIPAHILRENAIAIYESQGSIFVATPFPLSGPARDAVAAVLGDRATYVAAGMRALAPLRRQVLREAERGRRVGEILLNDKLVNDRDMALAVQARQSGERLGETLVRMGFLSALEVSQTRKKQAAESELADLVPTAEALALIGGEDAARLGVLPLQIEDGKVLVAVDSVPSDETRAFLLAQLSLPFDTLLVESRELAYAIKRSFAYADDRRKPLGVYLLERNLLTRRQLDEALQEADKMGRPFFEIVVERGLLAPDAIAHVSEEYFSART